MDGQVDVLGIFQKPLVGKGITADDDRHASVFQCIADRPVAGVHRRPGADGDTVLLIDDLVHALILELVGLDGAGDRADLHGPGHEVPVGMA